MHCLSEGNLLFAGIPVASRMLQDVPGYSLYKAVQMPFGLHSADFACAQSYTSKRICELPGNLTVSNPPWHCLLAACNIASLSADSEADLSYAVDPCPRPGVSAVCAVACNKFSRNAGPP